MSYDEVKAALTTGTGIVELDVDVGQPPGASYSTAVARKAAYEQLESIVQGERVAHLYTKKHDAERAQSGMSRSAAIEMPVTMDQARELMKLGAKWVGPDARRP